MQRLFAFSVFIDSLVKGTITSKEPCYEGCVHIILPPILISIALGLFFYDRFYEGREPYNFLVAAFYGAIFSLMDFISFITGSRLIGFYQYGIIGIEFSLCILFYER